MGTPEIVNTNGPYGEGTDFSSVRPVILCNTSGYALSNPSIRIVNTDGPYGVATNFSSLYASIFVNTSGVSPV